MPIFSEKSGKSRNFGQAWCLTGGLADVRKGKAFHRNLIRWIWPGSWEPDWLGMRLQGAVISGISPAL
jgi:hypothetical protein